MAAKQKQKQSKGLMEKPSILVVCHGNICRSPLAGAILAQQLGQERVRDRGLKAKDGGIAAKKVREYALTLGIDLSTHRTRCTQSEDVEWADIVLYMDNANREKLETFPGILGKARCLAEWTGKEKIPDPNYMRGDSKEFRDVMELIVKACRGVIDEYR